MKNLVEKVAMVDPGRVASRFILASADEDPEYATFPVAAGSYRQKDPKAFLTHCCKKTPYGYEPICKRVKPESILDDTLWGDLDEKPSCKDCLRKDPRRK